MTKQLIYIIILMLSVLDTKAQYTPLLSQYMFNQLAYNPGYAGSNDVLTLSVSDRHQWVGFDGAPVTQTLAAHTPLKNENIALGLMLFRDVIGKTHNNGLYASYAYRIKWGSGKLSLGLTGGFSLLQARLSESVTIQSGDEVFSQNTPMCFLPNFSMGAYYYSSKFYAGFSTPFIFSERFDDGSGKFVSAFEFNKNNFILTGGYNHQINNEYTVKPSLLWRTNMVTGSQLELDLAVENLRFGGLGIGYRTKDAIIILLKAKINNQMFFGYSYGLPVSRLSNYNSGTHEFYLTYLFKYESKTVSSRFF
ncbi:MAG: type IX secretion system membrane protein PorP/SprF [Bacteroidales bacterium]|nr:type IX secretion system membrane protein PorP/SprF [Bacteroidales bacterium]